MQALLARANAALERGRGAEAAPMLTAALRSATLTRDDELAVRLTLAEAWLLPPLQARIPLNRPDAFVPETGARRA